MLDLVAAVVTRIRALATFWFTHWVLFCFYISCCCSGCGRQTITPGNGDWEEGGWKVKILFSQSFLPSDTPSCNKRVVCTESVEWHVDSFVGGKCLAQGLIWGKLIKVYLQTHFSMLGLTPGHKQKEGIPKYQRAGAAQWWIASFYDRGTSRELRVERCWHC